MLNKFVRDTRGAALILFTIMVPVIIGLIGLAVDASRYRQLNTELKDLADAAALAGAKELDGQPATETRPSAIQRARDAAMNLLTNNPRWADSNGGLQIEEPRFFSSLGNVPANDVVTTSPEAAYYIEVTTKTRTLTGWFIAALASDTSHTTRATSVAGTTYAACEVTPLRICYSPPSDFNPAVGTQFRLRAQSGGTNENGDFAIVDPPNDSQSSRVALNLGSPSPNFCFSNGNTVTPGNRVNSVCDGMNVRFDIYPGGGSAEARTLQSFAPAPNVLKGNASMQCTGNHVAENQLPRDTLFRTTTSTGWQGTGDWKSGTALDEYLNAHHSNKTQEFRDFLKASTTRYQLYLRELGLDLQYDQDGNPIPPSPIRSDRLNPGNLPTMPNAIEDPYPANYFADNDETADESLNPDRRVFYVAIVDCSNNHGNATPPRRSNKYARMFMTEPVTPPNNGAELYAEFINFVKPGDASGVLHEIVQLYR